MNDFLAQIDPNVLFPSLIGAYAAIKAAQAAKNTRATGNGFAKDVRESLRRIEDRIDKHLENHR